MTFPLAIGKIKSSARKRYEFGVKVKDQAPKSPIYQTRTEVHASADALILDNDQLKAVMDKFTVAEALYVKARADLGDAVTRWDSAFDFFHANGEKFCTSANEAAGLGFEERSKARYELAPPLAVTAKQDFKKSLLRVKVKCAPGMKKVRVEVSRDGGLTWAELEGTGAIHEIPSPTAGTWLVRAASVTAKARSEYTATFSVVVK